MKATFERFGVASEMSWGATFGFVTLEDRRTAFLHSGVNRLLWKSLKVGDVLEVEVAKSDKGWKVTAAKSPQEVSFEARKAWAEALLPEVKALAAPASCFTMGGSIAVSPVAADDEAWQRVLDAVQAFAAERGLKFAEDPTPSMQRKKWLLSQ